MAQHFLHHLHDRATWLSGKLWVVKWMFHDIIQVTGISCLTHNIPLSVRDKNLEGQINLSHQILYCQRANLLHTFGVILMAENPRQNFFFYFYVADASSKFFLWGEKYYPMEQAAQSWLPPWPAITPFTFSLNQNALIQEE